MESKPLTLEGNAPRADRIDHWKAQCERIKQQKLDAAAAKVQAENDYANARTQQEAEQAEKAIKDAIAHIKVLENIAFHHKTPVLASPCS